jgi:hypothetical protein
VGIPLTVGFRPQLVVVSGLSVGIPLTVGFRPQLVVISGLSVGIPLTVGFRLSRSLWLSQSPFTNSSSFTMEFWLSRSLSYELFSFFTVEFWLSRSLSHELSSFFHDGISAITEPFHNFFFHIMEFRLSRSLLTNFSFTNLGYHGAFSRIFLSHNGISAITEPFHEFFFHIMESHKMHDLGEDSFHIYHKEYLHRIRLVKNLAS